ncbi:hypothetical protein DFH08DRAFT_877511 [Mycena albidolilacea]|uniref:Uncharacterized protein n=1 Tax=Mycena albidolilacea TaxID=1033008 RepID=A0AAD6ZSF6_9AGAR|nr:hypothetical protein DFH08DRAFT_877511 [Mycena albidolilacea]
MFRAFQIALLIGIISHALLARALEIDVPPAPVLQGTFVSVGWTATDSDPLAFSLDMICGGKVTVSEPVDRVTATNTTGQVTYGTVCLGDHFVEAVTPSAPNTPFTTSSTFQVVSAATPTSGVPVITQTITHTVSPTSSADAPQSAADGRLRTLEIVSAILGATTFALALLVILLFLRLRKPPQYVPAPNGSETEEYRSHVSETTAISSESGRIDPYVGVMSGPLRPPSYHKQRR